MLRHAAGPGFGRFVGRHGLPFSDAAEFRQRHVIDAVVTTIKASLGGRGA